MNVGFTYEAFAQLRPYLYHLTVRANFPFVRRDRALKSAAVFARAARRTNLLIERREQDAVLQTNGRRIVLRDQRPFYRKNCRLEGGWTLERLLQEINGLVFFWPGNVKGPINYGARHYARYESQNPIVLRVPTASLPHISRSRARFCKYNSGSPRCYNGVPSPRGPQTFVAAKAATFSRAKVVEVVFDRSLRLPNGTEWAKRPSGPWQEL